jgi:IclR family transcriptional regulator, acetate operon repressor
MGREIRPVDEAGSAPESAGGVEPGARNPVLRTLDLLTWMATEPAPWSVRSAARALGTSPPSVHRLMSVLESRDLVWRDELGRYYPGYQLVRMGEAFSRQLSVKQLARPYLERLARATTETVLLAQFDLSRPALMFVDLIRSTHPITYITTTYDWKPLHTGATGLVILAFLTEPELEQFFETATLTQSTPRSLVTPAAIRRELAVIADRGYAITKGQRTVGAVGLGAPLFDAHDRVIGSLCLTIPEQRFDPALEPQLARALMAEAEAISHELKEAGLSGRSFPPGDTASELA